MQRAWHVGRLVSVLTAMCALTAPAAAQDDPFDAPSPEVRPTRRTASEATVRVIAVAAVTYDAGAEPGRRAQTTARAGLGTLVERGLVVTDASLVADTMVVLVTLPGESESRVAYVVRIAEARGLALLAVPSARRLQSTALDRRLPGANVEGALSAFVFPTADAAYATARAVTLGRPHASGRVRVVGVTAADVGAPLVAADERVHGVVHVEPDGERTMIPASELHAFHDELRAAASAITGASAQAEALACNAALSLLRARGTRDARALAAALSVMGDSASAEREARVRLDAISPQAELLVAATYLDIADLEDAASSTPTERTLALRQLARAHALAAVAADPGLRDRSPFAVIATGEPERAIAEVTPPTERVETPVDEPRAPIAPTVSEEVAPPTTVERADRPRGLTFEHAPRFLVLSLAMPFAPDSDVHVGGVVLDISALWLVPKGSRDGARRFGLALGPSVGLGTNGGTGTGRLAVELGAIGRFGRKPGVFINAAWAPCVFFAEGERVVTATSLRARLGVAIGRSTLALGYDVVSPNGLFAYHAVQLAFVRER